MIGRQIAVALRRPLQARLRTQTPTTLCIRTFSQAPQLLAGRPKKAEGETTKPKRAPKSSTKSKTVDAAAKKVEERKKAAAKKAADAKKKKPKKALTPEQVEQRMVKLQRAEKKQLKEAALKIPSDAGKGQSAYLVFAVEQTGKLRDRIATRQSDETSNAIIAEHGRWVGQQWTSLTDSEKAPYEETAKATREKNAAAYKSWVESHTPEEINIANCARRLLNRRYPSGATKRVKYPLIRDERKVKAPMGSYFQYSVSRNASGDFSHLGAQERAKQISAEWKAMEESEKKPYEELAKKDAERYAEEHTAVYGRAPGRRSKSASPKPAE